MWVDAPENATTCSACKDAIDDLQPRAQEPFCTHITAEKKYFTFGNNAVVKRNLTRSEFITRATTMVHPDMPKERLKNEVTTIEYIRKNTDIPLPNVRCAFEDHGRYYVVMDVVPGVRLDEIPEHEKAIVIKEIEESIIPTLRRLRSNRMGAIAGPPCLPFRLAWEIPLDEKRTLQFKESDHDEFVFCHNDLSQHNIMVDPETLKINAVLDWEYAGFYPAKFEGAFYKRPGPAGAIDGSDEIDDVPRLLELYKKWKK